MNAVPILLRINMDTVGTLCRNSVSSNSAVRSCPVPHQRPLPARSGRFSPQDMAVMAGWLAVAAQRGYSAAMGTCDDGVEWIGISPPGAWSGEFWEITPEPSAGGFVVLDQQGEPWLQSSDIRGALRFVAPLPPGIPEPQPIPRARVPAVDRGPSRLPPVEGVQLNGGP